MAKRNPIFYCATYDCQNHVAEYETFCQECREELEKEDSELFLGEFDSEGEPLDLVELMGDI